MKPPQGLDAAFEDDPHGVRELLRGLPEPGPMPAAVSDRIEQALAAERSGARSTPTTSTSSDEDAHADIRELLASQPSPGPMPDFVAKRITVALDLERKAQADHDPTGMRDLLRGLPEPGPMPQPVFEKVEHALALEQSQRGERPDNVAAFASRSPSSSRTSRDDSRGRRGVLRLTSLAAAAAVAGVVAVGGYQAMQPSAPGVNNAGPASSSSVNPDVASKVHVTSSDRNYTAASFVQDAGALARSDASSGISTADAAKLGSVATPQGALQCAAAIGQGVLDDSSRITVDIAKYEGKPALVVVVTKGTTSTGWVLNRNCDQSQSPVAGPTQV